VAGVVAAEVEGEVVLSKGAGAGALTAGAATGVDVVPACGAEL
jgi:predicted metalloprotease